MVASGPAGLACNSINVFTLGFSTKYLGFCGFGARRQKHLWCHGCAVLLEVLLALLHTMVFIPFPQSDVPPPCKMDLGQSMVASHSRLGWRDTEPGVIAILWAYTQGKLMRMSADQQNPRQVCPHP